MFLSAVFLAPELRCLTISQFFSPGRQGVNIISATRMTTKASSEKNDTDEDGHGQDRVTEAGGQDHVRSARDHVTEIVTVVDEKPRFMNVL